MSKFKKQYVIPIRTTEDKQRVRDWVGTHSGMSILKADWVYAQSNISVITYDIYVLGITNPKTEMLFILSFPEAIEKNQFDDEHKSNWGDEWTVTVSND